MTRVIAITGASGRLGRACAREFARRGEDLALVARGRDRLEAVAEEVRAEGSRALVLAVDVSDPDAVEHGVARIEDELGPIDVWVNAASASVSAPFEDMVPEDFRVVTEVAYLGSVYSTMAVLERMKERDRGVIVQLGTTLSHRGLPRRSACSGAGHALRGFQEALHAELSREGSAVRVPLVPLPDTGAEDAARAVVLAADRPDRTTRRYPQVVGATAVVAGGVAVLGRLRRRR